MRICRYRSARCSSTTSHSDSSARPSHGVGQPRLAEVYSAAIAIVHNVNRPPWCANAPVSQKMLDTPNQLSTRAGRLRSGCFQVTSSRTEVRDVCSNT